MSKKFLFFFFFLIALQGLQAQRTKYKRNGLISRKPDIKNMITLSGGPEFCFGESGTYYNPDESGIHNFDLELGYRLLIDNGLSCKVNLGYANFTGSDKNSEKLAYRNFSNLANVFELSARAEYSYYFGPRFKRAKPNSLYVFIGLGAFNSNNTFSGTIQPAREIKPVAFGAFVPYGFGYQREIDQNFFIGGEVVAKYAFSDYVDGFHSIRYSRSNDVMAGFKLTVGYKLK